MERRICLRGRTDFPVLLASGYRRLHGRGIEISPSGIIVDRGLWLEEVDQPLTMRLTRAPEPERSKSTLMNGYCFSNMSANCLLSGMETVVYQTTRPSFLA